MSASFDRTDKEEGACPDKNMQLPDYQKDYDALIQQDSLDAGLSSRISFWRGITFVLAAIPAYTGFTSNQPAYLILSAVFFILFLTLVRFHNRLDERQRDTACRLAVTKDNLARFNDDWKQFPTDGSRYIRNDRPETEDLDIFGKSSLYQYLCTAGTIRGQDQLAKWLDQPLEQPEKIRRRQQAVAELAGMPAFTLDFESAARTLKDSDYETARQKLDDFFTSLGLAGQFPRSCHVLILLFPALTVSSGLLAAFGFWPQYTISGFLLLAFLQLSASFARFSTHHRLLAPVYRLNETIDPCRRLLALAEGQRFESPFLKDLQKTLTGKGSAHAALKELEKIKEQVVVRHNLLALVLFNCLFLYDFHCAEKYIRWQSRYRDELKVWLDTLGKIEALISLGVLSRTKNICTMPEIADRREPAERPLLSFTDLRHPLLRESLAVGSTMTFSHNTCIITGSNMSGKTTFMRSIGVNLVLSYAGGCCAAKEFCASVMELRTSMRIRDDVSEGISTFYAELLRIRNMMEASRKQLPMIALIDEIYKGTNSADRIYAARETVRQLSLPYVLTVLTTHDSELCDLEQEEGVDAVNYHFSESYEHNQILFDYKIRKGRCQTANARYLLRMAGILE